MLSGNYSDPYKLAPPPVSEFKQPINGFNITIYEAQNLKDKDLFGSSDPYVRVKSGKHVAKTAKVKGTLNPIYNETLSLPVDLDTREIYLDIYDKDFLSDDFLAKTSFRIDELYQGPFNKWIGLVDKKGHPAGEIRVAVEPHYGPIEHHSKNPFSRLKEKITGHHSS